MSDLLATADQEPPKTPFARSTASERAAAMALLNSIGEPAKGSVACKNTVLGYICCMFDNVPFNWANIMKHVYDTVEETFKTQVA